MKNAILTYSAKHKYMSRSFLRRVIQKLGNNIHKDTLDSPEFKDLLDGQQSCVFKICWSTIICICFLICCYQVTDRIKFFYSYPVAVDIHVGMGELFSFPGVKFCSAENEYLLSLEETKKYKEDFIPINCIVPIISLLESKDTDITKLWPESNISNTLKSLSVSNSIPNVELFMSKLSDTIYMENTFLGQCTVVGFRYFAEHHELRAKLNVSLHQGHLCSPSSTLVSLKDIFDFRTGFPADSGFEYTLEFQLRTYSFYKTPNSKCVEIAEFDNCYEKCIQVSLSENAKCRLPFFKRNVKLPPCKTSEDVKYSFRQALSITLTLDVFGQCKCSRPCTQTLASIIATIIPINSTDKLLIASTDEIVVNLIERPSYSVVSLLSDVGGNVGLYLGMSILSALQIVFLAIKYYQRRHTNRQAQTHTSLDKLIIRVYKTCNHHQQANTSKNSKCPLIRFFHFHMIVQVICLFFAIGMTTQRVQFYLTYPVSFIVEVEPKSLITFPPITICGPSGFILIKKKKYADTNNITHWCDVDTLDLLNYTSDFDPEFLWKNYPAMHIDVLDIAESIMKMELLKPNSSIISTHLGNCHNFVFSEVMYSGLFTMFPVVFTSSPLRECYNNYYSFFHDEIGSPSYNILTENAVPVPSLAMYDFQLKTVTRLNTAFKACTDNVSYQRCLQNCLNQQLKRANLCRLPFIKISTNVTCDSVATAKDARGKYVEIVSLITAGKTCKCVPQCKENIIRFSVYTQVLVPKSKFVIGVTMANNMVEHVVELEKYSIISLFCDIGNSLGLALGMSVLALARNVRIAISLCKQQIKK